MANLSGATYPRVPPIKLLGLRRAFISVVGGALLGVVVGLIVAMLFLPAATTEELRQGLLVMTAVFGLFFGPILTLAAACRLAVGGFSSSDIVSVGWTRLILSVLAGCGLGIGFGFVVGAAVGPSDAIAVMAATIGGIAGALVPGSVLAANAAKRRVQDLRDSAQVAAAVNATHRAADHLERVGLAHSASALRSSAAGAQASLVGAIDAGGHPGEYRLLQKRTQGGGVVFWIREARFGDDKDFLFKILLSEAGNLPESFRQRFLQGSTFPERRTFECPNGGHELHVDLRP